jgi:pimeloyl-ACP methyl ester carboxylesterase
VAGPEDAPVLLLLHGFPPASHQFRRLIALATSLITRHGNARTETAASSVK